ncbi:TOBE domain-containing protein [Propioniciclava coleopterorum]|uniref:TOBE domain-containing protein n=1 Tax=Propioniciclava coleopterorum TaxID=2714937 RepID=UPI001FE4FE0B|nr:TOBE domain-containing protein [Propioniciclava coleopterorum]
MLREGRVQQIGTPEDLYDHPQNWHVADFMGYRNLLTGRLASIEGDRARVDLDGLSLTGPPIGAPTVGAEVRVAIRPDDLVAVPPGEPRPDNAIDGTVLVAEYHGSEFSVGVDSPVGLLHVRTPLAPQVGEPLTLTARRERVLVFPAVLGSGAEPARAEASAS